MLRKICTVGNLVPLLLDRILAGRKSALAKSQNINNCPSNALTAEESFKIAVNGPLQK